MKYQIPKYWLDQIAENSRIKKWDLEDGRLTYVDWIKIGLLSMIVFNIFLLILFN